MNEIYTYLTFTYFTLVTIYIEHECIFIKRMRVLILCESFMLYVCAVLQQNYTKKFNKTPTSALPITTRPFIFHCSNTTITMITTKSMTPTLAKKMETRQNESGESFTQPQPSNATTLCSSLQEPCTQSKPFKQTTVITLQLPPPPVEKTDALSYDPF